MQSTHIVIFMGAVVSGVLNFYGLSELASDADWWLKTLFAMTAIVVTLSLSLFWRYAFSIIPDLSLGSFRTRGWATIFVGLAVIIALSTYWNVLSLTRGELDRLTGNAAVETAEVHYANALSGINTYRTYVPDISSFAADANAMLQREVKGGGSGKAGKGPVSNTIGQVAEKLGNLVKSIDKVERGLSALQDDATACLVALRIGINSGDREKAARSVSCINQLLAQMSGQDPATVIVRSLSTLIAGVVVPATVRTQAQKDTIAQFLSETKNRANKISAQIAAGSNSASFEVISLDRPNVMEAVLIYWRSLIPPIATALAIDLLPLVLLVMIVHRNDDKRARNLPRGNWTAADLQDALAQIKLLELQFETRNKVLDLPDYIDVTPSSPAKSKLDKTRDDASVSDKTS